MTRVCRLCGYELTEEKRLLGAVLHRATDGGDLCHGSYSMDETEMPRNAANERRDHGRRRVR